MEHVPRYRTIYTEPAPYFPKVMNSCVDPEWLKNNPVETWKVKLSKRKGGYPADPGTGPKGETCGSCFNLFRNELSKTYLKCLVMRDNWTGGPGTDVKSRSPSCSYWKPKIITEPM